MELRYLVPLSVALCSSATFAHAADAGRDPDDRGASNEHPAQASPPSSQVANRQPALDAAASPPPRARKERLVRPPARVSERSALCDAGHFRPCFELGRTLMTALFVEIEDARISYRQTAMDRTGLRGGWGVGARFGVAFADWVPLHLGIRHASPHDDRAETQSIVDCRRSLTGGPTRCADTPHDAATSAGGVLASLETGVEPNLRLARGFALSPAALLGYVTPVVKYERSIDRCATCPSSAIDLRVRAAYAAASLRLSWDGFGLALRYERLLGGDLKDAIALAFDIGIRHQAVSAPLAGEE